MDVRSPLERQTETYVSTGHLPSPRQALVTATHQRFQSDNEGGVSQVYPTLAWMPSDLFDICVVGTIRDTFDIGDAPTNSRLRAPRSRSCSH
jgi:glutaminase